MTAAAYLATSRVSPCCDGRPPAATARDIVAEGKSESEIGIKKRRLRVTLGEA